MAEYPKYFLKGSDRRVAQSARQAVKYRFDGYREVPAEASELNVELTEAELTADTEAKPADPKPTTKK